MNLTRLDQLFVFIVALFFSCLTLILVERNKLANKFVFSPEESKCYEVTGRNKKDVLLIKQIECEKLFEK
jgi:hypothetical protein